MKIIVFEISVEVPDDESEENLKHLENALEDVVNKMNFDLYDSCHHGE